MQKQNKETKNGYIEEKRKKKQTRLHERWGDVNVKKTMAHDNKASNLSENGIKQNVPAKC